MERRKFLIVASSGLAVTLGHKVGWLKQLTNAESDLQLPFTFGADGTGLYAELRVRSDDTNKLLDWAITILGKVNRDKIGPAAPNTLLCKSASMQELTVLGGLKEYESTLKFLYRAEGWSVLPYANLQGCKVVPGMYDSFAL